MVISLVHCGSPVAPQHGSLENYTNTTEGAEIFYNCGQSWVPEGRTRAVCTRNGWSPNPADLSCESEWTRINSDLFSTKRTVVVFHVLNLESVVCSEHFMFKAVSWFSFKDMPVYNFL